MGIFSCVFFFLIFKSTFCILNLLYILVAEKGEIEGSRVEGEQQRGKVMEGVASIALLPDGSISGHFIELPHSVCYGLQGTGMLPFALSVQILLLFVLSLYKLHICYCFFFFFLPFFHGIILG